MKMLSQDGHDSGPLFGPKPAPRRVHPGLVRRRKLRRAKVAWSTWAEMRMLSMWARAMTVFHGVQYVVDHQVPLSSPLVCGLHCSPNLKVITKAENDRKQNTYWPDMWGEQLDLEKSDVQTN